MYCLFSFVSCGFIPLEVLAAQLCRTLCGPMPVDHQAPLSMDFSKEEYWSGLPLPTSGNLHDPRIKPGSSTFQADSLPYEPPRKPLFPLLTFYWNAPVVLKLLLLPALINCSRIFYEVFWASRQYNWCWKATRINESFSFPWSLRDQLSLLNFALRIKIFNTGLWGTWWCRSLMPSDLS